MGGSITSFKTVALDTSIWIYHIQKDPDYFYITYQLFKQLEKPHSKIVFSVLGLTELLTGPKKLGDEALVNSYLDILSQHDNLAIINVDRIIAEEAAELRARYNLRTPDAIHLATAIVERAEVFITNDTRLKRVKDVKVMTVKELK